MRYRTGRSRLNGRGYPEAPVGDRHNALLLVGASEGAALRRSREATAPPEVRFRPDGLQEERKTNQKHEGFLNRQV